MRSAKVAAIPAGDQDLERSLTQRIEVWSNNCIYITHGLSLRPSGRRTEQQSAKRVSDPSPRAMKAID